MVGTINLPAKFWSLFALHGHVFDLLPHLCPEKNIKLCFISKRKSWSKVKEMKLNKNIDNVADVRTTRASSS